MLLVEVDTMVKHKGALGTLGRIRNEKLLGIHLLQGYNIT